MVDTQSTYGSKLTDYDFDIDALWAYLERIFDERVVVLDGGMGTEL
jgi:hypothetical protein